MRRQLGGLELGAEEGDADDDHDRHAHGGDDDRRAEVAAEVHPVTHRRARQRLRMPSWRRIGSVLARFVNVPETAVNAAKRPDVELLQRQPAGGRVDVGVVAGEQRVEQQQHEQRQQQREEQRHRDADELQQLGTTCWASRSGVAGPTHRSPRSRR